MQRAINAYKLKENPNINERYCENAKKVVHVQTSIIHIKAVKSVENSNGADGAVVANGLFETLAWFYNDLELFIL